MAARPVSAGGGAWRRRLPMILLVVSLALNLCFVGGAVWVHTHAPPTPAERFRQMSAELNLDAKQQAAFTNYVQAMRTRGQRMRQEVEPLITAAWAEVAKPQADQAKIMQLFDEAAEKRHALQRDSATQTLTFLDTLSPEQRSKFVAIARESRGRWWRWQIGAAP